VSGARKSEETWLVVASTGAALVNLVASAVTGLDRYDRILFLTGANTERRGNTRDIEAERGFDRLLRALAHEACQRGLQWRPPEPDELTADMNDPSPWMIELAEFFGPSGGGRRARHIVYVYTGGTKDMTLGCWDGFAAIRNQRPDLTIEFVSKQERRVFWPKEPHRAIALTGGANHVSIESYLLACGYEIINANNRSTREKFALAHAEPLGALGEALLGREDARRQQWIKLLNCLSAHERADIAEVAQAHNLPQADLYSLHSALNPLLLALSDGGCTLSFDSDRLLFCREAYVPQQQFQGDWFEDWLFLRARDALKATGASSMHALKIRRLGAVAQDNNDYEIDLAILANNQLYIGEAKSVLPNNAKQAISRLSALRKQVVGPPRIGKAWFVSGEPAGDVNVRREMAEHQDVQLVVGAVDIGRMIGKLREMVG
jgi:hypothetical protein